MRTRLLQSVQDGKGCLSLVVAAWLIVLGGNLVTPRLALAGEDGALGVLDYTGRLRLDGALYSGEGLWKFAIVDAAGKALWTNDGSLILPPAAGVVRKVSGGVVGIALGRAEVKGEAMQPIPSGIFSASQTYLRAWVAVPTTAQPEELVTSETPVPHAQAFTSVPYSHRTARASQADEADHAARADQATTASVANSLVPSAAGQPVRVQGDLVVQGKITSASSSDSTASGKQGKVTFDSVTTKDLIVTGSVSLPGGSVVTSTVTQVQTLVVTTSATFTGPVTTVNGVAVGSGTIIIGPFNNGPSDVISFDSGDGTIHSSGGGRLMLNPTNPGPVVVGGNALAAGIKLSIQGTAAQDGFLELKDPLLSSRWVWDLFPGGDLRLSEVPGVIRFAARSGGRNEWRTGAGGTVNELFLESPGAPQALVLRAGPSTGPSTVFSIDGGGNTTTTGNLAVGGTVSGNGSGLTNLNAGNLATGTVPPARLPGVVARTDQANTFTANQTMNADLAVAAGTLQVDSVNRRVGIGTISPGARLHVEQGGGGTDDLLVARTGTGVANDKFKVSGAGDATLAGALTYTGAGTVAAGGTNQNLTLRGSGTGNVILEPTGGNVGIGTTAPVDMLHLVGGHMRIDIGSTLRFKKPGDGDFWRINEAGNELVLAAEGEHTFWRARSSAATGGPPELVIPVPFRAEQNVTAGFLRASAAPTADVSVRSTALAGREYRMRADGAGRFLVRDETTATDRVTVDSDGMVTIFNGFEVRKFGTSHLTVGADVSVAQNLHVAGNVFTNGADVAERFESAVSVSTGDALVPDPNRPGMLTISTRPRDPSFVGIVSWTAGLTLGKDVKGPPVALVGRVLGKVSAENGPVLPGMRLTTAEIPGHLMVADNKTPAEAIVGISLGRLESGTGLIEVVLK